MSAPSISDILHRHGYTHGPAQPGAALGTRAVYKDGKLVGHYSALHVLKALKIDHDAPSTGPPETPYE